MRYSDMFGKTRHDPPCDADSVNAKLLTQAGFIEKLAAGIYNFLPLGKRVLRKIETIIREEMDGVGGQELLLPALQPIDIWKKTGRDVTMDDILYRTSASGNKEFVFGPSHEEAVTPLVSKYVQSYKDLPLSVYQVQTKFRDEPRAKSGLLRGREFGMKDMYSFHTSDEDLDRYYEEVMAAYSRVYDRCGLVAHVIEASGGAFSDKFSHEFSVETAAGEDTIIICDKCKSAQNLEIAEGSVQDPSTDAEDELPMEEVDIERDFSVAANAKAHDVSEQKILKTVVYEVDGGGLLGVVIRGDLSVSDVKLENYVKKMIRPATTETLKEAGLVQGYISPVKISDKIDISFIGDHSIKNVKNFVTGANANAKDLKNVNLGRDFTIDDFTDLVEVSSGFDCSKCGKALKEITAVEVGNIFKLGTKYSEAFDLNFTDQDGVSKPVVMGCYGIGTSRLLGTIVESRHDDKGIIWPMSVSPYHVHLLTLGNDDDSSKKAEDLYKDLSAEGVEVLFDERDERAGVKLNDADLLGIPIRIVLSKRSLENGGVEWKLRDEDDSKSVDLGQVIDEVQKILKK
ncbi:proline--tRNA ligase [Candidatus Peregrinibacteria bacterium]|jgi:prolyl-tRNA synthetase|nr:proline--tRNA ligase [Candidatus Peregrinibacteria bacterium]MBT7736293.1 proline--tRNA ligase [Candidatus Peregrinibacteria bacterium]